MELPFLSSVSIYDAPNIMAWQYTWSAWPVRCRQCAERIANLLHEERLQIGVFEQNLLLIPTTFMANVNSTQIRTCVSLTSSESPAVRAVVLKEI